MESFFLIEKQNKDISQRLHSLFSFILLLQIVFLLLEEAKLLRPNLLAGRVVVQMD